jgi:prepilin-type N-terminal cleavage/methylation domain-containing protein
MLHLKRAFTLIEVMIVITILGVIAAIIVPAVSVAQATKKYSVMNGHVIMMNGQKIMIVGLAQDGTRRVDVILLATAPTQNPLSIQMDRDAVYDAFLAFKAQAKPEYDNFTTPR